LRLVRIEQKTMPSLPFSGPFLLAPMEGVTEPCFRDLVLERNAPEFLGGAFTEFARVSHAALGPATLRGHLGPNRHPQPVGLQLMGADVDCMAASAACAAEHTGVSLIDLNFGCPAKGALKGRAGAALLDEPRKVEAMVAAVVHAVPHLPVSAKIRAGGEDDALLGDLARAVEAGGAALLSVHCRTRREGYGASADWDRLRLAVAAVATPVCGNGGIACHADLWRMLEETGCRYAMAGRAALADPWIFQGREVCEREAAVFLVDYAHALEEGGGADLIRRAGRIKQLLRYWSAGGLVVDREGDRRDRRAWLGERDPARLLHRLETIAAGGRSRPYTPAPSDRGPSPAKAP